MNNEVLNNLKKTYKDIKEAIDTDFKEIRELEESSNADMERYKYLKKLQDMVSIYKYQGSEIYIESEILSLCINSCGLIEETNNIYLLMYIGNIAIIEKILGEEYVKSVLGKFAEDKSNIVVYYIDIENPLKKIIVPIEEQEKFENTHIVVNGKQTINDCNDRYYNLRSEFFNLCIKQDQEKAVKLILEKYSKKRI